MKRLSLKIICSLVVLAASFFIVCPRQAFSRDAADTYFPYVGRITGNGINVRAGASTGSEIMYQLEEGADVIVIGEDSGFCRISPPKDARAWIHKTLIKDGAVVKDNVNVRAGATLSSSVLGNLSQGDPVTILQEYEDWYQIEMPSGMGYAVHKDFVKYLCPLEEYEYFLEKEKKTRQLYQQAEDFRREELKKKYQDVNYELIIQKYQAIIDSYPDSGEAQKSLQRVADAEEKKKIAQTRVKSKLLSREILAEYDRAEEQRRKVVYSDAFDPAEFDSVIAKYDAIVQKYPDSRAAKESLRRLSELKQMKSKKMQDFDAQTQFSFAGTLQKGTTSATDRATHKVISESGALRAYVFSDSVDLRAYEDKKIQVEGKKYTTASSPDGQQTPVLKLEKIQLKD